MEDSKMLSSKAEINTNMTMVELKGGVVSQLTSMNDSEINQAVAIVEEYIKSQNRPNFIMLLSNELRYYTTFELNTVSDDNYSAREIVKFLLEDSFFIELGGLKLIENSNEHLEVWAGETFFAMFNYDGFVVEI